MHQVHGTCVAIDGEGVLLRGPSGCGKSDLALRLIDDGARLVADDRTDLRVVGGRLHASAPRELSGLLEVRGMGIARLTNVGEAPLAVVVDLIPREAVERLPEGRDFTLAGVAVPLLCLAAFEASAAAKVRLAVRLGVSHIIQVP